MRKTIEVVIEMLQNLGFDAEVNGESGIVKIGDASDPFVVVLTVSNDHLNITCQVATQGEFDEEQLALVFYNALCENSRIRPFAFEIIDSRDDPSLIDPREFPIILGDSIAVEDLSEKEVEFTMQRLIVAISSCREVLAVEAVAV